MKNRFFTYFLLLFISPVWNFEGFAQQGNIHIRNGNKAYANNDYKKASEEYQKALSDKSDELKAKFNMGDAYYRQGQYDQA
ncbi:MAG TPA: tetratricopeptide repeat protein, partial [Bacteroidia bacterium]|nr:tetratricopeptide repeat protein [Bacteroidia bacterium]